MNAAVENANLYAENVAPGGARRVLGGKRSLSGKPLGKGGLGGLQKRGLGGGSARRALGDITNRGAAPAAAPAKARASRPVPRDAHGRVEEPETLPLRVAARPAPLPPKIDLFADDEYGPAMARPMSTRSVDARAALLDLRPAPVAPSLGVGDYAALDELEDAADIGSDVSLFSADELLPIDEFPGLALADFPELQLPLA